MVVAILAEVTVFTVAMVAVYMKTGGTPDTLIVSFFSFIGGEAGVLGLIRYGDSKYPKQDAKHQHRRRGLHRLRRRRRIKKGHLP